jgi:virulence-associated protein VapD
MLNINYSTAKTILRIFRLEKRNSKKNCLDLNSLKIFKKDNLKIFKIIKNHKKEYIDKSLSDNAYDSISNSTYLTNLNYNSINNNLESQQLLIKSINEAFHSPVSEINFFKINYNEN